MQINFKMISSYTIEETVINQSPRFVDGHLVFGHERVTQRGRGD